MCCSVHLTRRWEECEGFFVLLLLGLSRRDCKIFFKNGILDVQVPFSELIYEQTCKGFVNA